jgi:hypothetical protein
MRFRAAAGLLATVVAVALSVGLAATAQAATPSRAVTANVTPTIGTSYEIVTWNSGPTGVKCVDVPNASGSPGVHLQIFHCNSSAAQLFQFTPASNDGVNQFYQIMNASNHLCWEIASDNTTIEQLGCVGFDTMQWRIEDRPDFGPGAFDLRNKQFPTMCATTRPASPFFPSDHDGLVLGTCGFGTQIWRLG